MFKIENETDLHCKVVHLIRNYCPDALIVAGLAENQDTPFKRTDSWKKGYTKGQPDLMVLNHHKDYIMAFVLNLNLRPIITKFQMLKER